MRLLWLQLLGPSIFAACEIVRNEFSQSEVLEAAVQRLTNCRKVDLRRDATCQREEYSIEPADEAKIITAATPAAVRFAASSDLTKRIRTKPQQIASVYFGPRQNRPELLSDAGMDLFREACRIEESKGESYAASASLPVRSDVPVRETPRGAATSVRG